MGFPFTAGAKPLEREPKSLVHVNPGLPTERGAGTDGNALFVRDLTKPGTSFAPLVPEITNDTFSVVDNVGDKLLVSTNHGAPNWRVVLIDPAKPAETNWQTVLAERPEPIESVRTAGGKLFATYLKDVTTRAYVHSLDGKLENEIALPGPGSANGFDGPPDAAAAVGRAASAIGRRTVKVEP